MLQPRGEQEPPSPAVSGPIPCQALKAISHIPTWVFQNKPKQPFFLRYLGLKAATPAAKPA